MVEVDVNAAEPGGDQPSEEEIREYARKLRALPAEQVIADTLASLLNCAQAKLGRRDARLLIDLVAVSADHTRDYVPADLAKQVDDMLGQLRLAQVTAEGRQGQGEIEENDLDRTPAPPAERRATATPVEPTSPPPAASKLWVPGR